MHSDLIAKLEALDGPDRDVDLKLTNIFDKHPDGWSYRWSELSLATNIKTLAAIDLPDGSEELYHQYLGDWGNGDAIISPKHYTASLDAAIALMERVLPDTDDRRHSCTIWTGRRPAARIFYRQRCAEDEGGWAIGALNNWDVRGATPAIALLIALLQVKEAQDG